jgi:hypothetical protein
MLALIVVGAIAYLLNREGAMNVEMAVRDAQTVRARYVAEAGLAYAEARLNAGGTCKAPAPDVDGNIYTGSMDQNGNLNCVGATCDKFRIELSSTASTAPLKLELKSFATLATPAGTQAAAVTAISKIVPVYTTLTGTSGIARPNGNIYDTYITNTAQTTNFGTAGTLIVDNGGKAGPILVKFDLTPNPAQNYPIPTGAKLLAASLRLNFKSATNYKNNTTSKPQQLSDITAHKITTAWDETGATYFKAKTSSDWISYTNSSANIPYKASTTLPNYSGVAISNNAATAGLANGGSDYDPAYVSVQNIDSFLANGDGTLGANVNLPYNWDITPLAAEWIAGADNYGFDSGVALKAEESLGRANFYSSEDPTLSRRPTLTLIYQIPCGQASPAIVADTYLNHADGTADNFNYGTNTTIKSQYNNNRPKHALVQFNAIGIPTSSTVNSAKLRLYVSAINARSNPSVNLALAVSPLISAWTEGSGTNALPTANDTTWKHKTTATNWGSNGGDYSASTASQTISSTFNVSTTDLTKNWIEFDVKTMVQSWVTTPASNYGFIIRVTTTTPALVDEAVFESRESALGTNFAPQLIVTYQ